MICGHCGTHVADGFKVCTGCGANYRRNLSLFKILAWGGFIAFCVSVISQVDFDAAIVLAFGIFIAVYVLWDSSRYKWYRKND